MPFFPDTSFLCALYRIQDNSPRAYDFMESFEGQIVVSSLVLWEFRQSARFQVFQHHKDKTKGFSKSEAERMLKALQDQIDAGIFELAAVDWQDVHSIAEALSATHTIKHGHRPMDILHLAAAKHLKLRHFLTFDQNQKKLALAEGFEVPIS
jgi:predicted nucleic acid-binding protein